MKDKQIKEVMGSIENRIRHIYNCGYQQGYEDGRKCKVDDLWKCYKYGVHEGRWIIKKPNWSQIPKCRDCKYLESTLMPCNNCKDNSEFEPAEERQTGEWIGVNPMVDTLMCSECGENIISADFKSNFCPNCGADMRKESE